MMATENVGVNVDVDLGFKVDTDVELDFVETKVEINVEAVAIVGDEVGQKFDTERRSTTMSGSFAFSLWMQHGFLTAFLGL